MDVRRTARELGLPLLALALVAVLVPAGAIAYPGGTPEYQTDVTPFCSACHASLDEAALEGAPGDRPAQEVAVQKHLTAIMSGAKAYAELSEPNRAKLVELIKAVDANSNVVLEFPPQVAPGETFQVTARLSGGSGPAVAVALVDRAHRWWAKSAATAGWTIVGAPTVIGPNGQPQTAWLNRRPERLGRNITFVNVTDWKSDAATASWAKGKVIFTMKAPEKAGDYPLVGVYWYGTEKATALSSKANATYGDQPLGGYTGKSGRVKFTPEHVISVR